MPKYALTPEIADKVIDALRLGVYRETASKFAGLPDEQVNTWYSRGARAGNSNAPYRALRERIIEAEEAGEMRAVGGLLALANGIQAQDGSWIKPPDRRALQWFLERKHPERWGRKDSIRVEHAISIEVSVTIVERVLMAIEREGGLADDDLNRVKALAVRELRAVS